MNGRCAAHITATSQSWRARGFQVRPCGASFWQLGCLRYCKRCSVPVCCGQPEWAGLLLFIACYATSCLINAAFDVALEAPMQGIWFWCLIGFGIGATMIYRCMQDDRSWKGAPGR